MNKEQQIVYDRFAEIVPVKSLDEIDFEEFENSLKISFKIIGYSLKNPEKFTGKSLKIWLENYGKSLKNPSLFQAIFQVWWDDNGY